MATPAQIAANQANAKLSAGPVTAEGKQRASMNAFRHGFRSKQVVLPSEDPAEYQALAQMFEQHHPAVTPIAARAVREMIDSEWRLRRVRSVIDHTLAGLSTMHQKYVSEPRRLQTVAVQQLFLQHGNLLKHELKLERQFDRALRAYRLAQRESEAQDQSRAEQAAAMDDFLAKARALAKEIKTKSAPDPTIRSGVSDSLSASRQAGVENPAVPNQEGTPNEVRGGETEDAGAANRVALPKTTNEPNPEGTPNKVRGGETEDAGAANRDRQIAVPADETQNATNEPNLTPRLTPRNAPCPCGSGLKHKRCCGKNAAAVLGRSPRALTFAA
jgi:hypothetical protein